MSHKLSKFHLPFGFRGKSAATVQLWWLVQATLFAWSPQFAYKWRAQLLRAFGAKIGRNVIIRPSVSVTYPWKLEIGDYSWVGDGVVLYTLGEITIADNVVVSQGCYLCTGSHDYRSEAFDIYAKPIVIEQGVWLASKVFIHPGVVVHRDVVVDACSVVKNDLKAGYVYSGFPAKPVKERY